MGNLLTDKQVAERLAVSTATVRKWRMFGTGPRFLRIGVAPGQAHAPGKRRGSIRYDPADLERYLATRDSGGERPAEGARGETNAEAEES
jgi:hypothetical protein